ncbi:molybdate ABC transporter substrate-binding protein [Methylomagnum ishizawai]|uniref:molybdate ABC transporter substrate-binding protein n=1 Tax=Methylomagnum ishizawai TaxID=1760988 RepID=UPI001C32F40C|nr:molybdate ABC transporter substrate-binding protein [Methylomagnum ishizawai]BBL76396.1 molybdate ABC transporter substrate-binding protein [Methylomagnum ishizawai]
MNPRPILKTGLLAAALYGLGATPALADITVYAAASLTAALTDIAKSFEQAHKTPVKLSFAASSALAKQIEQGAPADVFISADTKWVDYLDNKGKIDHNSLQKLLGNTLVLIAPKGQGFKVEMKKGFDFAHAFAGNLCTGTVESVPVGIYAKEALTHLDWWKSLQYRVVGADDVKAALNLIERGECEAGIVYETDAKQSAKVDVVARFPDDTHAPIVYPAVLVTQAGEAQDFLKYLQGPEAQGVFVRYGFKWLGK